MENSKEMEKKGKICLEFFMANFAAIEDSLQQLREQLETVAHRKSMEEPLDLLRHLKQDDLTSMLSVKKMEKKWQHVDDSDYDSDRISFKGSQISGPSGLSFKSDESKDFFITFSQLLIESTETAKKSAERNEEAVIEYLSNNCLCGQGSDLSDSSSEKDSGYEERNSKKKGQCTCLNNPLLKSAQEERKRAENYIVDTMKLILQRSQCWTSAGSASQSDHSKDDAINFKKAEIRSLQDGNMDKQKMEQTEKWCEAAGNTLIQQKPYSAPVASVSPYMPTFANNFGPSSSSSSSKGSQISGPSGLSFKSDESKDFFITFSQLLIESTETAKKSAERNEEAVIEYLSNNCHCGQRSDSSDSSSEKDSGYEERNSKKKGQCTCLNNPLLKSAQKERKSAENYAAATMKFILQRSQCWTSAGSASQSVRSKDVTTDFRKAETRSLHTDEQKMEQIAKWCKAAGNTQIPPKLLSLEDAVLGLSSDSEDDLYS